MVGPRPQSGGLDEPSPTEAFSALPHPGWLISGTLADNSWKIQIEDPRLRRDAVLTLDFSIPISPGRLLTAPTEWKDLLTVKTFIYYSLTGPDSWLRTTSSLNEEYRGLIAFLRWRNNRGIPSLSQLTREWFEEFCDSLRHRGFEGLVRSEAVAHSVIAAAEASGVGPPRQICYPARFSIDLASKLVGLDNSRQISGNAVRLFADWARRHKLQIPACVEKRATTPHNPSPYTGLSLDRYLRVWERLGRLKYRLDHDPLGYLPFGARKDSVRLANTMGNLGGRTGTAPAEQTCYLIDRSLRWVLLYSDELMNVSNEVLATFEKSPKSLTRIRKSSIIHKAWKSHVNHKSELLDGLGLPEIGYIGQRHQNTFSRIFYIYLRLLPAACGIVIAAFSARRFEEIFSLRDDCIQSAEGEYWLNTYIAKGLRGRERIPAPAAVAKAVSVLMWLSATARAQTESPWIFQAHKPLRCTDRVYPINFNVGLSEFAAEVGVPPLANGSHWSFTPHQFRRFFAVMYYYRYRDRSLTALSQFLCHHDPDSTRTYLTEARMGGFLKMVDQSRADQESARRALRSEQARIAEFDEVGLEFRVEVYARALDGSEPIGGWAGVRIFNELSQAKARWEANLEVGNFEGSGPTLDEVITAFASSRVLNPNGQGHSYCACGSSEKELSVAGCVIEARKRHPGSENGRGPDLRFAADMTCAACPHNVQLPENRAYWEEVVSSAQRGCERCPGTVLALELAKRSRLAKEHIARFHGKQV